MNELRTMSKGRKSLHIRQEAALIKPSRAKRRRYGKVWKKHVDLSDGGIFSSLTNDSDSDSEESGDDDAPETDLWDGGLFNSANDSDSDSDSDFEYIDVYEDEEEKELVGRS